MGGKELTQESCPFIFWVGIVTLPVRYVMPAVPRRRRRYASERGAAGNNVNPAIRSPHFTARAVRASAGLFQSQPELRTEAVYPGLTA
jgi:hypothetical protein